MKSLEAGCMVGSQGSCVYCIGFMGPIATCYALALLSEGLLGAPTCVCLPYHLLPTSASSLGEGGRMSERHNLSVPRPSLNPLLFHLPRVKNVKVYHCQNGNFLLVIDSIDLYYLFTLGSCSVQSSPFCTSLFIHETLNANSKHHFQLTSGFEVSEQLSLEGVDSEITYLQLYILCTASMYTLQDLHNNQKVMNFSNKKRGGKVVSIRSISKCHGHK